MYDNKTVDEKPVEVLELTTQSSFFQVYGDIVLAMSDCIGKSGLDS